MGLAVINGGATNSCQSSFFAAEAPLSNYSQTKLLTTKSSDSKKRLSDLTFSFILPGLL